MWFFRRPTPTPPLSTGQAMPSAIDQYLAISRSPLRNGEPEWWALAEAVAWEFVQQSLPPGPPAGSGLPPPRPLGARSPIALGLRSRGEA